MVTCWFPLWAPNVLLLFGLFEFVGFTLWLLSAIREQILFRPVGINTIWVSLWILISGFITFSISLITFVVSLLQSTHLFVCCSYDSIFLQGSLKLTWAHLISFYLTHADTHWIPSAHYRPADNKLMVFCCLLALKRYQVCVFCILLSAKTDNDTDAK